MIWWCRSDPINFSMSYSQIADLTLTLCILKWDRQSHCKHPRIAQMRSAVPPAHHPYPLPEWPLLGWVIFLCTLPSQPDYVNLTSGRRTLCRHYVVCQLAVSGRRRALSLTDPSDEDGAKAYGSTACWPTQAKPQWAKPSAAASSQPAYRASWRPFSISNLFTGIFFRVELLENLDFEAGWWFGTYYNVVRYDLLITLIENYVCVSAALNAYVRTP